MMLHHGTSENVRISGSRWVPFLRCHKKNPSGHKRDTCSYFGETNISELIFSFSLPSTKGRNDFFLKFCFCAPAKVFFNIESLTPARDSHAYFLPSHLRNFSCLCCKQYFGEDRDVVEKRPFCVSQGTLSGLLILCNR